MKFQEIVKSVCNELIEASYTEGVYDSALGYICEALKEKGFVEEASGLWSALCCLPEDENNKKKALDVLEGDVQAYDLYIKIHNESRERSTFVMPEWGTRGT